MKTLHRNEKNKQIAEYWEWVAKRGELGYWCLPGWKEHQNILASGDAKETWLDVLGKKALIHIRKPGVGLSLGCGAGGLESELLDKGLCSQIEACDISEGLVKIAQEKADRNNLPIKYFRCDLNEPSFEKNKYDLIIASGILHHIENLEGLFASVNASLKENGVFIVYDYVGPSRFQWTSKQIAFCNDSLRSIPKKYRFKRGYPWYYTLARMIYSLCPVLSISSMRRLVKRVVPRRSYINLMRLQHARLYLNKVIPPLEEQFLVTDPSEAVRSEEILPLLGQCFNIRNSFPQGGSLIQPIFMRIVENFSNNLRGTSIVENIFQKERELIENQEVESDFIAALMTKKR